MLNYFTRDFNLLNKQAARGEVEDLINEEYDQEACHHINLLIFIINTSKD